MPPSASPLHVFLHGTPVGAAVQLRRGAVHLAWSDESGMTPDMLSLSFPSASRGNIDITEWIDGLLPDNPRTRSRWAQDLGAASAAPFDLLSTRAGLECAGAVQFHPESTLPAACFSTLVRLGNSEIAEMLRRVIPDSGDDTEPLGTAGIGELRLSLGGAQAKMALRRHSDDWLLPTGTLATTHILKPQRGHRNQACRGSIAVNEHLCQTAVRAIGLDTAPTALASFDSEPCVVVERYDRSTESADNNDVGRLHSEDLCQALGVASDLKYQRDGGPTPETIMLFLRQACGENDARKFFLSLYANWLIGNTDGHAKNYSLLLHGDAPRLAPLYDLNSALPYLAHDAPPRPAMQLADGSPATLSEWAAAAERLRAGITADELGAIAAQLPAALEAVAGACPPWAQDAAGRISKQIADRVRRIGRERRSVDVPAAAPDDSTQAGVSA